MEIPDRQRRGRAATIKSHRKDKITLRSYTLEPKPHPKIDSKLIKETGEKLRCSSDPPRRPTEVWPRLIRA